MSKFEPLSFFLSYAPSNKKWLYKKVSPINLQISNFHAVYDLLSTDIKRFQGSSYLIFASQITSNIQGNKKSHFKHLIHKLKPRRREGGKPRKLRGPARPLPPNKSWNVWTCHFKLKLFGRIKTSYVPSWHEGYSGNSSKDRCVQKLCVIIIIIFGELFPCALCRNFILWTLSSSLSYLSHSLSLSLSLFPPLLLLPPNIILRFYMFRLC